MPCACQGVIKACCDCTSTEVPKILTIKEQKKQAHVKRAVLEYLYGSKEEKPRKIFNRQQLYHNASVQLDKNSRTRRKIAQKRIKLMERHNRRSQAQTYTPIAPQSNQNDWSNRSRRLAALRMRKKQPEFKAGLRLQEVGKVVKRLNERKR